MKTPDRRESLGEFLNQEQLTGTIVEVGCAHGGFARMVLKDWKGSFYYMVDPWKAQDPDVYKERQEEPWKYDRWFDEVIAMAVADHRIRPFRMLSSTAVSYFDDASLDSVYIDGNHDLEHCYEDICLWYPKVRPGGLFGGHDCYNATTDGHYCQVKDAVDKWFKETGNAVVLTDCSSWWHRKPVRYVATAEDEERMAQ